MRLTVALIAGASRRVVGQNIGALRRTGLSPREAAKVAYREADRSGGYQRKGKSK
jgi:hypothetical protein